MIFKNYKSRRRLYSDELKDDFQQTKGARNRIIGKHYHYLSWSPLTKLINWFLYYFIAVPYMSNLIQKKYKIKVIGRNNLRHIKRGYVMYCNHTTNIDPFILATKVCYPRKIFVVANKDAVTIPVVGVVTKALGVLPIADTFKGMKDMDNAITKLLKRKIALLIYPEAHIWHWYAGVRPYPVTSFKWAAKNNVACVPTAVTYRKQVNKKGVEKAPKIVLYVGKPIYNDEKLSVIENASMMHDYTINFMKENIYIPENYSYYKYRKSTEEEILALINKNKIRNQK